MPYCVIGLALALGSGGRKNRSVWIVGLVGWAVYYGLHCWKVSHLITAAAEAHRQGWVRCGGLTFVVADGADECRPGAPAGMGNGGLLRPGDRSALPVGGPIGDCGLPWPRARYIAAFSFVGQEFNRYWGLMLAPLFCYGAVHAPRALGDLWQAAKFPLPRLANTGALSNLGGTH